MIPVKSFNDQENAFGIRKWFVIIISWRLNGKLVEAMLVDTTKEAREKSFINL
jgi:hypothetical protein